MIVGTPSASNRPRYPQSHPLELPAGLPTELPAELLENRLRDP